MHGLIFDLDGCLIDSSGVQKKAFFGAYEEVVGDDNCPTYEEYIKYTGDSVDNVMKKLGLPDAMAPVFRRISEESVEEIIVFEEAIDYIRSIKKDFKIAICTGKDRYRVIDILKHYHIDDCFDALVCADDVTHHKPHPEPVEKALEALNISASEALMIGDGLGDIRSAAAAGVPSVLTLWYGEFGVPREADYTAETVADLKEIVTRHFND